MRRNTLLALTALALVAGFTTLLPAQAPKPAASTAWEYRMIAINDVIQAAEKQRDVCDALEAAYNALGKEGFDFVDNRDGMVLFKRQKR